MHTAELEPQRIDERADERQRWNSFLSDLKNQRVEPFWRQVCAANLGNVPLPLALPGAEPDSVQLAWDTERYHLDVTIPFDGPQVWFFMDRRSGELPYGVYPGDANAFDDPLGIVALDGFSGG